jgi:hypothetical protein
MTDVIDNIVKDKQDVKNQLGGDIPDVVQVAKIFSDDVTPLTVATKFVQKTYDGSANVFILGSATYGVLGTNELGDAASSETLYAVVPKDDQFVEYFGQDLFIDTASSNGTLDTTNENYVLTAGQILQSEVIAKKRVAITNAKVLENTSFVDDGATTMILGSLELGTSTFGAETVVLQLSNDSGSTWHDVVEDTTFTFPSSGTTNELKYKITSISSLTLTDPIKVQLNL